MLGAVWFRYVRTLWRSRVDSASMMVRPLITAVLFVMFASAVAPDDGSRAFLVVSVMIVNVVANTVIGAAYEARTDVAGGRLELVVQSPGVCQVTYGRRPLCSLSSLWRRAAW